jgi:hypothetical protein
LSGLDVISGGLLVMMVLRKMVSLWICNAIVSIWNINQVRAITQKLDFLVVWRLMFYRIFIMVLLCHDGFWNKATKTWVVSY